MKHGKRELPRSRNCKAKTTIIALALIFCCGAGGTLAWLVTNSGPVTNTFTPARVECSVSDEYQDFQKTKVIVSNPSDNPQNVDSYVRVTFVATWEDSGNNAVAKDTSGFSLPANTNSSWFKGSDGYYYYKNKLQVGKSTPPVFDNAITVPQDNTYSMNVQVLAEAIQADGPAVQSAWPVAVGTDGTLSAN